jgi:hypothetical protein
MLQSTLKLVKTKVIILCKTIKVAAKREERKKMAKSRANFG